LVHLEELGLFLIRTESSGFLLEGSLAEFIPDRFPGSEIDPGFGDGFILFLRRSQNERYEWKLWMLSMDQNIVAPVGSFRLLSIDCILFLFYERSSKFF
jgi:hypothetical protein